MVLIGTMNARSGSMNVHPCYTSFPSQAILPSTCFYPNKYTSTHFIPPMNILSGKKIQYFNSCVTTTRRFGIINSDHLHTRPTLRMGDAKIAIIGGGICGVTAAHAIKTRLQTIAPNQKVEIVIYEGDDHSYNDEESQEGFKNMMQPTWKAASAKNANSLVPGAAMHVMSQRSTLEEITKDSMRETYLSLTSGHTDDRDFSSVPPYFGLDLSKCLGWHASWEERRCFFTFMFQFIKTSLLTGEREAKDRGKLLVQLAKANSCALKKYLRICDEEHSRKIGLREGFISVHRTKEKAIDAQNEAAEFGIEAELLSRSEAIAMEPKIADLPLKTPHFVHRKHDQMADCAEFIRGMIKSFRDDDDITYEKTNGAVQDIELIKAESDKSMHRFKVRTSNGAVDEFDYVVLAAGVYSPIFASKISWSAGQACPIFPLRGYSMTIFTKPKSNLPFLSKAMSFDKMYCTSVAPNMVRLAGFGEVAGFPNYDKAVCSKCGPMVIEKYGTRIFGKDAVRKIQGSTLPCYRPISPDDVPIVGAVKDIPRLFFHCGHGTLGWTLSLATAHCLAQDICDDMLGVEDRDSFVLPDGSVVDRIALSPDRFTILP